MIVLAIVAILVAIVGSFLIVFANGMATAPSQHSFFGLWIIVLMWAVVLTLWLAWWVG